MWKIWIEMDDWTKERVAKNARWTGLVLIFIGSGGVIFPEFMSMAVIFFVAWLMLLGGLVSAYFTWNFDKEDWLGWLKAFVLFAIALFLIFKPLPGIAAVGLLLSIYFLFDAFGNFGLAFSMKPANGWWWWLINGIISLILATVFLVGWPFSSMVFVGLFVGISLLFDGVVLFALGSSLKKEL